MSGGPRPPVPGLIPLAALSRRPGRPRRRPESIDAGAGSRCLESRAAAPGRRRHHRRRASAAAAVGKQSRSSSPALDRPPRVNPIFVWVRQEDTRIVEVKCEDYDKRNRILLTKTAHGWRAIPRTEMLGAPRVSAEEPLSSSSASSSHAHHHRHHHKRRSRKSKSQQSTSVQFPEAEPGSEPSWVTSESVNIESLLPSHTIQIKRIPSSEDLPKSVNNAPEQEFARTVPECSTPDKVCDVSPLENLLAVAELELKQHMQSGNWNPIPKDISKDTNAALNHSVDDIDELLNPKSRDIEAELIDAGDKSQECSYNDDDEMSMNDILSRLEQSLQSPQGFGSEGTFDDDMLDHSCKFDKDCSLSDENSKIIRDHSNESDEIPESSNVFSANIKEELTENNLINYHSNLYASETTTTEVLEPVESLYPSDPKQDDSREKQEETKNEYLEGLEHPECKAEFTEDLQEQLPDLQDAKSQDYLDHNSETPETKDCTLEMDAPEAHSHLGTELEPHTEKVSQETLHNNYEIIEAKEVQNEVAEAESSTTQEREQSTSNTRETIEVDTDTAICLDLSLKNKASDFGPTDLSIRKLDSSPKCQPPRPLSQNSEAIQSPQPSGIPAIPASPDIVTTSTSISKPRSVFLESLLATSLSKMAAANAENALSKSKEPLDLGQCRKSASPTVTCSEEVFTPSEAEPPLKKMKPDDITLKNLLDKDIEMLEQSAKKTSPKDAFILPDTPRLLSLLKASSDTQDPLAEYKQLLLEIDIPNPLMVPKDVFPDLLKHPRREILKILSGHSSKNVSLDDILVVYKDKLLAAIKSNSSSTRKNSDNVKTSHKQTGNRHVEQNNNVNEKTFSGDIASKRKVTDNCNKTTSASPDNKNSLANDIDAANEAAFNPLFWTGCPNPFEAMNNYANHNEFIQALYAASSLPYMPGQLGEFHPSLQMMLGNKLAAPLGFSPIPHVGFNNPFELSMWQEAMMQANILKNKNPYENAAINPQTHRSNVQKKNHQSQQNKYNARLTNGHSKNISQSHQSQQQAMMHPAFGQAALTTQPAWQNPYLGVGNFSQGTNNLSLDTTQFNPFSHKNNISPTNKHSQQLSPPIMQKKNRESLMLSQYNDQEKRLHHQMMQEHQKIQQMQQQQKLIRQHQHQQLLQQQQQQMLAQNNGARHLLAPMTKKPNPLNSFNYPKECSSVEVQKPGGVSVPMDLSGAHSIQAKSKSVMAGSGKANGMVSSSRSHMDDVPEVGSTTSSIEDMQDGHAQLWHPLFGSQNKGYSPWSLPSLAAMGE